MEPARVGGGAAAPPPPQHTHSLVASPVTINVNTTVHFSPDFSMLLGLATIKRDETCEIQSYLCETNVCTICIPEIIVSAEPKVIQLHHHRVEGEQVVTTELVGLK
jgi:hypothetical protein